MNKIVMEVKKNQKKIYIAFVCIYKVLNVIKLEFIILNILKIKYFNFLNKNI